VASNAEIPKALLALARMGFAAIFANKNLWRSVFPFQLLYGGFNCSIMELLA